MRSTDRYGRVATDLRVSLTDRCNLRCSYCMPAEGLDWLPDRRGADRRRGRPADRRSASSGSASARCGSPAASRCCAAGWSTSWRRTHGARARPQTSLTTNALGLARTAQALADAGLDRVNVSLDTIRPETFREITRRDRLHDVIAGLEAARDAGLGPVKVNAVLLRGINDDQAPELLRWCRRATATSCGSSSRCRWTPSTAGAASEMVTAEEIFAQLERRVRPDARRPSRGGARPAELFLVDGGPATVGRDRLGHPAVLRRLRPGPADRRRPGPQLPVRPRGVRPARRAARRRLRRGDRRRAGSSAMRGKLPGHGIDDPTFLQPDRPMSAIGG